MAAKPMHAAHDATGLVPAPTPGSPKRVLLVLLWLGWIHVNWAVLVALLAALPLPYALIALATYVATDYETGRLVSCFINPTSAITMATTAAAGNCSTTEYATSTHQPNEARSGARNPPSLIVRPIPPSPRRSTRARVRGSARAGASTRRGAPCSVSATHASMAASSPTTSSTTAAALVVSGDLDYPCLIRATWCLFFIYYYRKRRGYATAHTATTARRGAQKKPSLFLSKEVRMFLVWR